MRIFCFGDFNTYGYDARSMLGERLGGNERWPEILGKLSGWEVVNEGMNGQYRRVHGFWNGSIVCFQHVLQWICYF